MIEKFAKKLNLTNSLHLNEQVSGINDDQNQKRIC